MEFHENFENVSIGQEVLLQKRGWDKDEHLAIVDRVSQSYFFVEGRAFAKNTGNERAGGDYFATTPNIQKRWRVIRHQKENAVIDLMNSDHSWILEATTEELTTILNIVASVKSRGLKPDKRRRKNRIPQQK